MPDGGAWRAVDLSLVNVTFRDNDAIQTHQDWGGGAIYAIVFLGGTPIGAPISGWIAEELGARTSLAFGAFIAVGAGVVALRNLAARAPEPVPAVSDA